MTTTRYAIELEPGKWWNPGWLGCYSDFNHATIRDCIPQEQFAAIKRVEPQARIVPVKCEVQDE